MTFREENSLDASEVFSLSRFPNKDVLSLWRQCNAMILRRGKQVEGPKGVSQDEHMHDGNDVVVEKKVSTSSIGIIGNDTHNSMTPGKFPQDLIFHLYHSLKEWLRLSLTSHLGSF